MKVDRVEMENAEDGEENAEDGDADESGADLAGKRARVFLSPTGQPKHSRGGLAVAPPRELADPWGMAVEEIKRASSIQSAHLASGSAFDWVQVSAFSSHPLSLYIENTSVHRKGV